MCSRSNFFERTSTSTSFRIWNLASRYAAAAAVPAATAAVVAELEYQISLGLRVVVTVIAPKAIVGSLHPFSGTAIKECPASVREIIEASEARRERSRQLRLYSNVRTSMELKPRRCAAIEMYSGFGRAGTSGFTLFNGAP